MTSILLALLGGRDMNSIFTRPVLEKLEEIEAGRKRRKGRRCAEASANLKSLRIGSISLSS